jgi:hypothetical protein
VSRSQLGRWQKEFESRHAAEPASNHLEQAIEQRQPPPGLVHHSDRGLQYAAEEYAKVLRLHGIVPSMSRPANPYDNAFCESFMRTLKREEIDARSYRDLDDLRAHVAEFIEQYYNRCRLHSALGYRPPEEFEQMEVVTEHNLAGGCGAASMSFPRHGEIYRPMYSGKQNGALDRLGSPAHRHDESPAGYSLSGCSPAEPDSASPAEPRVNQNPPLGITKNSKRQVRQTETVSTLGVTPIG